MNKLVSIILPTYNGGRMISGAIQSVLEQSYAEWELLVVDDGSQDDTRKAVECFTKDDTRIRYIQNLVNLGIQKTLNIGLKEAKGEYVARIDDDDVWIDKDKLKIQVEFLEKNRDHVLVGTGFVVVDESGREIFKHMNPTEDKDIRDIILSKNCFAHSGVLFRKETALIFGGYSEDVEVRHIEDYDLWLKLGTVGKLTNIHQFGVRLLVRSESISSQNNVIQMWRSLKNNYKFKEKYPNYLWALVGLSARLFGKMVIQVIPGKLLPRFLYRIYKNL